MLSGFRIAGRRGAAGGSIHPRAHLMGFYSSQIHCVIPGSAAQPRNDEEGEMTDPGQPKPPTANPGSSLSPGSAGDAGVDRSGSTGKDAPDIQRLRQAWREGVESGGYQPAETIFAELGARYETPHRGA